jgi:hypothetical protein
VELYIQKERTDSVTKALWQFYRQSSSSKQEELEKETMNLAVRSIFAKTYQLIFLYAVISYDLFTSLPNEGVLRNFIALKNP